MIKLFIFTLILLPLISLAQEDFNLSFENWTSTGQFENPTEWDSSNETFMIGTFVPVTIEPNAYDGDYAVKLKSIFISQVGSTLIGVITLGDFEINTSTQQAKVTGGKPYTKRPSKLVGYYKYSPNTTDSCGILIDLFKFNSSSNQRDTIGSGMFTSSEASEWTYFELPINYFSIENPDSLNIIALSSDTSDIKYDSTLWLDKLSLLDESDISEKKLLNSILIYPNPSNGNVNFMLKNILNEELKIQISDIFGRIIYSDVILKGAFVQDHIDLSNSANGIYFFSIKSKEFNTVKKIILK